MRLVSIVFAAILLPPAAQASDGDKLAAAISKCWKPPAAIREARPLDALIDERGEGEFRVPGHDRTKVASDPVADSLLRAAARCAPYDVPAGLYQVTVKPHDPFEGLPNARPSPPASIRP